MRYSLLSKCVVCVSIFLGQGLVHAQSMEDFIGNWRDSAETGIISLYRCKQSKFAKEKNALCGRVVWDIALTPERKGTTSMDCNRQILFAKHFENGAWTDGWVYDIRDHKTWHVSLRMKADKGKLHVRMFVGNELNGKTETFTRVTTVPPGCAGIRPDKVVL